ncbi:hypothetical protein So717_07710 [Roseobacter cerasinus]|uniref:Uncharacterized protein n=1 Tax=Roseobacter cerasinus TaxID=2602289 RepID=A0A640VKQ9_9RHOB|nr:AAA family ATPase [Roseobacter cerasinus]GFE49018.1 hypothetical protein So717_07710 [Roseobacter cerasinus]
MRQIPYLSPITRLGPEIDLPSAKDVAQQAQELPKQPIDPRNTAFERRLAKLVAAQRAEREALLNRQVRQRINEIKARQARLPTGRRGMLARATGQFQKLVDQMAADVMASETRDRIAQQALVTKHLTERRALTREGQSQGLSSAFLAQTKADPKQALLLKDDGLPHSQAQLIARPELVLDHVSQTKASFKRVDVLRALAKHIDDPLALQTAAGQAMQSSELVRLARDGTTPAFTTRDYQKAERDLDQATSAMSARHGFGVSAVHIASATLAKNRETKKAFGGKLSLEQQTALHHVLGKKQLSSVVGLAGAGKSTLLATAHNAWAKQGMTVHGAALAGKAAEELQTASSIQSRTIASLELSWKNGYEPIAKGDVLVIDDAR